MVTTPREIEEALVGVGVPEDRARRIAHAVDRAEHATTKEDLEHATALTQSALREMRLEMKVEFGERLAGLDKRLTVVESRLEEIEGRLARLEQRMDAEALRNDQRHRQLILAVLGVGVSLLIMLGGGVIAGLLRLFEVI